MFSSVLALDITCDLGVEGYSGDDWGLRMHELNSNLIRNWGNLVPQFTIQKMKIVHLFPKMTFRR